MSEIEVNIGIKFRRCPGVAPPHALIAILGTCRSTRPMFGSTAGSQCSRGNVRRGPAPAEKQPAQPDGANGGTGIDVFGAPVFLPRPRRPHGRPAGVKDSYQRVRRGNTGTAPELDPDVDLNLGHDAA